MTTNLTVVPMQKHHLKKLSELECLCFSEPWSYEGLHAELENDQACFFVAEQNGSILGYVGMYHVLLEGYITNIAVFPDARRQGVGKALLTYLSSFARKNQFSFLTLEVRVSNFAAIRLYEHLGYEKSGVRYRFYRHPEEDALIMTNYLKGEFT